MAQAQDFLLNTITGDLKISNGDFQIGLSDLQHIRDIISANQGEWQEFPNMGVGIDNYIDGSNLYQLNQNINIQLENDGYTVDSVNINYNQVTGVYSVNAVGTRQ